MSNIWFFEKVDLFDILCPHLYKQYAAVHSFSTYKKSDFIYMENAPSNKIYLVAEGKVKIAHYTEDGKEVVKAILTKGELFGEMALLGEESRTDFAQALEDSTTICPMGRDVLQELMRQNTTFSLKVYKIVGLRIKRLERQIDLMLFKDTRTRLIEFIKELMEYHGTRKGPEVYIEHPYTQKDIADLIGTTRPTVNALLKELCEENCMSVRRGRIRVRQQPFLNLLNDINSKVSAG